MLTTTTTIQKWGATSAENQSLVYRVVGTLEYISSLRHLDAFLRSATSEELAAAEKLISARPEFTVYTRISNRFRLGTDAQAASPGGGRGAVPKKGLMWVVALARLEVGAILGTFTTHASPFEVVGPTQWELPAYQELLMDGAQTHVMALANDPNVRMVEMKLPGTEMLTYIRRLNLARAMLSAAARSNASALSPLEWSQLEAQDRQLLNMRDRFAFRVNKYVASLNSTNVNKTVTEKQIESVEACASQLIGERRELAAGTARVQTFVVKR